MLYLVNKPCQTGRIVRGFLILLEFDFTVVVKKGTTHQRADHLSRLTNGESATGVADDLPDAYMFNIDMVPSWSKDIVPILTLGKLQLNQSIETNIANVELSRNFLMLAGRLYKQGNDQILRLCIDKKDAETYLNKAHVAVGNIHFAPEQTLRRVEHMGVFWPTMRQDVYSYVRACTCELGKEPTKTNAMTLFQINTIAPKWASTIVDYLTKKVYPKKMSEVSRQRYLQKQAQDFCVIVEQL